MTLAYAAEKYTAAMRRAILSRGTLQRRLTDAFRSHLSSIEPERDLPPGLREEHAELHTRVTRIPGEDGSIAATFAQMSDQEATEVAEHMIYLYHQVRGLYDAPTQTRADGSRVLGNMEAMILATEPEDRSGPPVN